MRLELNEFIEHWREAGTPLPAVDASRDAALRRARELLDSTTNEEAPFVVRSEFDKSCLYAIVESVVEEITNGNPQGVIDRVIAERILSTTLWTDDRMDELADLQQRLSVEPHTLAESRPQQPVQALSDWDRAAAETILALCAKNSSQLASELRSTRSEALRALCDLLDKKIESGPGPILDTARLLYSHLEAMPRKDPLLKDERELLLGELARIAGTCCRVLTLRPECREWLDKSTAWFLLAADTADGCARVGYQRLALHIEERNIAATLQLAAPLIEFFQRAGARELALKCQYVKAMALRESGKMNQAAEAFENVCGTAREIGSAPVLGATLVTLTQVYSDLERADDAMRMIAEADGYLRANGNKVALAKLHWGVGLLLRKQNRPEEAVNAFRSAQGEFLGIQMPADVAALHLVIADVLLESGQERQAEWEIRAALPVIDELKMVPEGFAAMSLLRESLRRRSIDRQALRSLHGYFEDLSS